MRVSIHLLIVAVFGMGVGEAKAIDFAGDVLPILRRACFECHGANKQEGDLRLDRREDVLESWTLSVESPSESELLRRISLPRGDEEVMPAIGKTLSQSEIEAIRQWIVEGAAWPEVLEIGEHWAYVAPRRPDLPTIPDTAWPKNEIDWFVLARLQEEGLGPSPEETPEKLIRRVFLDLIGLPPRPDEVRVFCDDPSEETYAQIVDDLLARPQFGERWARPWLDLARYADSHGFQRDNLRDIWAYRDWVIRALNDDMPFDQFTIEQIAGDLLPNATESQRIATGFHRCTPTNVEAGSLPEETRIEQVIDRVNTTGAVWLGTTLECAQCHDHKYDPFTMKDYYRLLAFYNSTEAEAERSNPKVPSSISFRGPSLPIANPTRNAQRALLEQQASELRSKQSERRKTLANDLEQWAAAMVERLNDLPQTTVVEITRISAVTGDLDSETIPTEIVAAVKKTSAAWSGNDRKRLLDYRSKMDAETGDLDREIARLEREIAKLSQDTTLVMVELDQPRMTSVFQRGDYRTPGETVEPGLPTILHSAKSPPRNRLALAHWLADPANPLVGRVTVNRWWAELFGQGIVMTVEDFGIKGEPPTHPKLLDWLAVEFTTNGWSMKSLLRTIVMSATYRQSSRITPQLQQRDDSNRLLARGPRFRMDAEMIRDNALAAAGLLSLKQFGPPIRPYQPAGIWSKVGGTNYDYVVSPGEEQFRRGIYVVLKRGAPYPSLINFDATARLACTVKRSRTNTPLQALTLLNDPVYVEAAKALATRILTEPKTSASTDRIEHGFLLCTSRHPTEAESRTLLKLFEDQMYKYQAEEIGARQLVGNFEIPANITAAEFCAWYSVATTLLNLHETITKE